MLIAWISITGLGILLGKHFRIFVLAPAFAADVIAASVAAIAGKISALEALEMMVLACVCLQIGYLIGLFLRSSAPGSRPRKVAGRTSEVILPLAKQR